MLSSPGPAKPESSLVDDVRRWDPVRGRRATCRLPPPPPHRVRHPAYFYPTPEKLRERVARSREQHERLEGRKVSSVWFCCRIMLCDVHHGVSLLDRRYRPPTEYSGEGPIEKGWPNGENIVGREPLPAQQALVGRQLGKWVTFLPRTICRRRGSKRHG